MHVACSGKLHTVDSGITRRVERADFTYLFNHLKHYHKPQYANCIKAKTNVISVNVLCDQPSSRRRGGQEHVMCGLL